VIPLARECCGSSDQTRVFTVFLCKRSGAVRTKNPRHLRDENLPVLSRLVQIVRVRGACQHPGADGDIAVDGLDHRDHVARHGDGVFVLLSCVRAITRASAAMPAMKRIRA
jgi:hypothetical protein